MNEMKDEGEPRARSPRRSGDCVAGRQTGRLRWPRELFGSVGTVTPSTSRARERAREEVRESVREVKEGKEREERRKRRRRNGDLRKWSYVGRNCAGSTCGGAQGLAEESSSCITNHTPRFWPPFPFFFILPN